MSEADQWTNRTTSLAEFDRTRDEFARSYDPVPDEALSYVPEGEDYTLGGLAVHVKQTLEHYGRVVDQMKAAGYQAHTMAEPPDDAHEVQMVHQGYGRAERTDVIARMRTAHDLLVAKIRALPEADYLRVAPIVYGEGQAPYDTRAADVMGWVIDHYRDHTTQVADLLTAWRAEH